MEKLYPGKKGKILSAASKIFAQNGFHLSKIEDIAREAGVAKGTVYEYFSSKDQLCLETFKAVTKAYMQRVADTEADGYQTGSHAEKLKFTLYHHLMFIQENWELARVLMTEPFGMGDSVRQWCMEDRRLRLQTIQSLLVNGIAAGEFKQVDPEISAQLLLGAIDSLSFSYILEDREMNPAELVEKIFNLILLGIKR